MTSLPAVAGSWLRPRRLGALFVSKLIETSERRFEPLGLKSDQFNLRFLVSLGGVLAFAALTYWLMREYWDVDWLAREDGALEWASVSMFLLAAVLAGATGRALLRGGHPRLGAFHLIVGVALILVVLEEVSWGQRLFGWSTPEAVGSVNEQDETNFHNITGFSSVLYSFPLWGSWIALAGAGVRSVLHHYRRVTTADFVLPSLVLAPMLLLVGIWTAEGPPAGTIKGYLPSMPGGSEFPELLAAFFLLFYTLAHFRRLKGFRSAEAEPLDQARSMVTPPAKPDPSPSAPS